MDYVGDVKHLLVRMDDLRLLQDFLRKLIFEKDRDGEYHIAGVLHIKYGDRTLVVEDGLMDGFVFFCLENVISDVLDDKDVGYSRKRDGPRILLYKKVDCDHLQLQLYNNYPWSAAYSKFFGSIVVPKKEFILEGVKFIKEFVRIPHKRYGAMKLNRSDAGLLYDLEVKLKEKGYDFSFEIPFHKYLRGMRDEFKLKGK